LAGVRITIWALEYEGGAYLLVTWLVRLVGR
jgi:hypothetical protein